MRSDCVPLPRPPSPPLYPLPRLPLAPQRPTAETDRNSPLRLPASEEFLTCFFPFVLLCFSFRTPTRSMVSPGKSSVRSAASFMFRRELDINGAEHCKNEGLKQAHQQLEE